jgi:hypothetical protein
MPQAAFAKRHGGVVCSALAPLRMVPGLRKFTSVDGYAPAAIVLASI